jgi:hypothetical protein
MGLEVRYFVRFRVCSYEESKVSVRIFRKMGRRFKVDIGLLQGCVISPWLFNIFIDGAVKELNTRVMGREAALMSDSGGEWQVNQILYANATALINR